MIRGECLCGEVRYRIDGNVSSVWLCHCTKCRKTSGSAFSAVALCRSENFAWQHGEELVSEYVSPSGYTRCFCNRCGSPLPRVDEEHGRAMLFPGALSGEFTKGVAYHIFTGSKADWWEIGDTLPQHDEHKPR